MRSEFLSRSVQRIRSISALRPIVAAVEASITVASGFSNRCQPCFLQNLPSDLSSCTIPSVGIALDRKLSTRAGSSNSQSDAGKASRSVFLFSHA